MSRFRTTIAERTQATLRNRGKSNLAAFSPFVINETEFLLIPNWREGSGASVMLIAHCRGATVTSQMPPCQTRQLAAYLQVAADEAEEIAISDTVWDEQQPSDATL